LNGPDRRGDRHWMAVIGSGNERPLGHILMCNVVHVAALTADHCQRKAVCNGLAIDHQIRNHSGDGAVSTDGMAEAGLDLIEYQ
jgi:hypothetical protein